MGWLERNDLLNWIDLIVSSDADARILLYGGVDGRGNGDDDDGRPASAAQCGIRDCR